MLRRRLGTPSSTKRKATSSDSKVSQVLGETYKDAREAALEEEILGVGENVIDALPDLEATKKKKRKRKKKADPIPEEKKWHDSDDEPLADFETSKPSWADRFDEEKSDDSDEEILRAHSHATLASSVSLPSSHLDFKRVTDGNKEEQSKDCLKCVEFHPKATVLMTGGDDHTVRLFAVDGSQNRKIHSMFLDRCPVQCCRFSRGGSEIIIGSKHKSFYIYDMEGNGGITFRPKLKGLEVRDMSRFVISPDGRFIAFHGNHGYIHLFSQNSKELVDSVKMNGLVSGVCFSNDGQHMYSFGSDGEVYVWNMNTRDCIHRFSDQGCIKGVAIAASPDNNYIVCGSSSGIVSVYDRDTALQSRHPEPLKLIKNLTTCCNSALFNSHSELLALRSKDLEKAVKLVHFPSMTVLPNFPEQFDNALSSVMCMDFSPSSGYLALGNNKGRCLLYRLQHYSKY
ncbi:U3 small nucleolar RNA-associated protein 18 homolog [Plakobranchus ocellatus]|uniref:U3 small nucleolar RNA-associated protein 18 homolog n=1 Tax=Plakobranchus ocellatus TaxID=259542 RepID=A0AAV3XV18_9GAST|nr:U3 small nucleolar RNA-associated protein 18 homolog [Plakobranchus ocellatus]